MSHLCRPADFYEKRVLQIARCLMEIFNALQMRPVRKRMKTILNDMDKVLAPMGRPLQERCLSKPLESERYVVQDFGDGTRIMALLLRAGIVKIDDLARLNGGTHMTEEQRLENLRLVNEVLSAKSLPALLDENEWANPPAGNFDTLFIQLHDLWMFIQNACADRDLDPDVFKSFQFKDGAPFGHTDHDRKTHQERAFQAAKLAHEEVAGTVPQSKLSRRFAAFVEKIGGIDVLWKYLDPEKTGTVECQFFCRTLSSLDFRLNQKRVFEACDVLSNGMIYKEDLDKFFQLATAEPEGALRRETEDNIMGSTRKVRTNTWVMQSVFGKKKRHTVTTNDVREFIALVSSLGGAEQAWPLFAGDGEDSCTMFEFISAAKKYGLIGDPKLVFQQVDVDRNGAVTKDEFVDMYAHFTHGRFKMELHEGYSLMSLVEVPDEEGAPWPNPSLAQLLKRLPELRLPGADYEGETRLPGAAEECRALFEEDLRRQRYLADHGAKSIATQVHSAAEAASRAVAALVPDETPHVQESLGKLVELDPDTVTADGPTPTTSLDARIVLTDRTERKVWLQTSVVDRTGTGSDDIENAAFVLEFRDQRHANSRLHAQIDVSMIQAIEHLNAATSMQDPNAHASFIVSALPRSNLGGSTIEGDDELWDVCHVGRDGLLMMYIVAGPSLWKRREAVRFFDELRIMVHFLSSDAGGPIATGITPGRLAQPRSSLRPADLRLGGDIGGPLRPRVATAPTPGSRARASTVGSAAQDRRMQRTSVTESRVSLRGDDSDRMAMARVQSAAAITPSPRIGAQLGAARMVGNEVKRRVSSANGRLADMIKQSPRPL